MSTNEERPKDQRTISDEDAAAKLFAAWSKQQASLVPTATPANTLSEAEVKEVRELIEVRKRLQWITGGLKTWAIWLVAIVGASTVGLDTLTKILKSLLQR